MTIDEKSILRGLPDGVVVLFAGKVRWANDAAHRMFQDRTREEVEFIDLIAPEDVDHFSQALTRWAEGRLLRESVRTRVRGDEGGQDRLIEVRFTPREPGENTDHCILMVRDQSKSTRADQLMSRLAAVVTKGRSIMSLGSLIDASRPIFQELGWHLAVFERVAGGFSISHAVTSFNEDNPLRQVQDAYLGVVIPARAAPLAAAALGEGRPLFIDNFPHWLRVNGTRDDRYDPSDIAELLTAAGLIQSAWVPINIGGEQDRVLAVFGPDLNEHDFVAIQFFSAQMAFATRVEQLKDALVRQERLAAVGEMSAVLAHEVRNPLTVMFNVVVGLRKILGPSSPGVPLLDMLQEEADQLKRLVSELLDFARPITPELRPASLSETVEAAVKTAGTDPECPQRDHVVVLDFPEDLPRAMIDPVLLRAALVNMLINACQHSPSGGLVRVSAKQEGSQLRLQLYNDGEVLSDRVAARVFEPFFTTRARGTGLGLAFARRVVEDHHGTIALDSVEKGVSFSIWLPIENRGAGR